MRPLIYPLLLCFVLSTLPVLSQDRQEELQLLRDSVNYDESMVPDYQLPALLGKTNDARLMNANHWMTERRPELMRMMQNEMYGLFPDEDIKVSFIINSDQPALNGIARRKEVTISVSNGSESRDVSMLIYIPSQIHGPAPLFVGLNFYGNHTIHADPGISIHQSWVRNNEEFNIRGNLATEESRGVRYYRWPVEEIMEEGFALATIYYGDIDPDFDDNFENGIHGLLDDDVNRSELSSLSAWAWMLGQTINYFQQDPSIDENKVAVIGHSRLGKAALWAGAMDQRFALIVSNDSGCGGAAISRRQYGETVHIINLAFPHWFSDHFNEYNKRVNQLPFDQHSLLACMAPRPLYVGSASEDQWADPKGEFTAAKEASLVYSLFDKKGLEGIDMPGVNSPVGDGSIRYHMREGKHNITSYDWEQYLAFARKHFQSR